MIKTFEAKEMKPIKFNEYIENDNWVEANCGSDEYEDIVQINIQSNSYNYYLVEYGNFPTHTIYRVKK